MPYRRSYPRRRRRFVRRRPTQPQRVQKLVNGKQVLSWYNMSYPYLKKAMAGLIARVNTETKENYLDTTISIQDVAGGGNFVRLTQPQQGTGYGQRIGNSVKAQSIYVKMNLAIPVNATTQHSIRMILYIDKQDPTADPMTVAKLFQAPAYPLTSHINNENTDRLVILKDKLYNMYPGQMTALAIKIFKKLEIHTKFTNGANTPAENNVYLFFVCNVDESAGVDLNSKFNFTDN